MPQVALILGQPPGWVIEGIGTINGERAVAVERAYRNAYFDRYLRHHDRNGRSGNEMRQR